MPITQDRLISLVRAAIDYQHAFARLRSTVIQQERNVRAKAASAEEALQHIVLLVDSPSTFLERPIETTKAIEVEHHHFLTHGRDNRRAARRAEIRRRTAGLEPRQRYSLDDLADDSDSGSSGGYRAELALSGMESDPEFENSPDSFQIETTPAPAPAPAPFRSSLTPADIRRLELEFAPAEHQATVKAADIFENDLLVCACGFEGQFDSWRQHFTSAPDSTTAEEGASP